MFLKKKIYFIAAIETDVGKTFFLERTCQKLISQKQKVSAIKPIISGFARSDQNSDSLKILNCLNLENTDENLNKISPWRFRDPISPHLAAKNENKEINFDELVNFCQKNIEEAKKRDEFLFIESAGGVMSPINDEKSFLDLANSLDLPILFISANYLSSISHSLCAISSLKSRGLEIEKIIINDGLNHEKRDFLSNHDEFSQTLKNFTNISAVKLSEFLS